MADGSEVNEAASRRIARQLFTIWSEEQEARAKSAGENEGRRALSGSWPAWGALVLSLGTVLYGAAIQSANISENRRRVAALEGAQQQRATEDRQMVEQVTRIETKLDLILGGKQ